MFDLQKASGILVFTCTSTSFPVSLLVLWSETGTGRVDNLQTRMILTPARVYMCECAVNIS